MMPQIPPHNTQDADSIIEVIKAGMPMGILCLVVGVLWHIAEICHERTWHQRLAVMLTSGAFGLVIGPIAFHMVPLIIPQASLSTCMAVSCMMAAMGPQGLAMLMRFLKGCSIVTIKGDEAHGEHGEHGEHKGERRMTADEWARLHASSRSQCEKDACCHCGRKGNSCGTREPQE